MATVQVQVKVAKQSFSCNLNGQTVFVNVGDVVRVGHPIMKGREHLFGPLHIKFDHTVKGK